VVRALTTDGCQILVLALDREEAAQDAMPDREKVSTGNIRKE